MHTVLNRTATDKARITRRSNKIKHTTYAYASGLWTGSLVPATTFAVAHTQAPNLCKVAFSPLALLWIIVVGGLFYSAPTVVQWFSRYSSPAKAIGFVIALEAAMTFTDLVTAIPSLLTLCAINGFILANKFKND